MQVARLGVGWRDRLTLILLGSLALLKDRSKLRTRLFPVTLRLGDGRTQSVVLGSRNDLLVLADLLINREYDIEGPAPERILDLGAHVGLAAVYLKSKYPEAQVTAVEANPALIDHLRRNVEALGIEVVHAAVAATSGTAVFYGGRDTWMGGLRPVNGVQQVATSVPSVPLGDLVARHGPIDLMKMDVEGAEWEICAGGFPDGVDVIVGEAHALDGRTAIDFLELLRRGGTVRRYDGSAQAGVFVAARDGSAAAP